MPEARIATCCYCGTRSVLKLTARGGHELACGRCGAPLHELKAVKRRNGAAPKRTPVESRLRIDDIHGPARRAKRRKPRKPVWRRAVAEILDAVEDIFD